MPRPPFVLSSVLPSVLSPVLSRRAFLALLSWRLCLAGGSAQLENTSCRIGTASAIIPRLTTAPEAIMGAAVPSCR